MTNGELKLGWKYSRLSACTVEIVKLFFGFQMITNLVSRLQICKTESFNLHFQHLGFVVGFHVVPLYLYYFSTFQFGIESNRFETPSSVIPKRTEEFVVQHATIVLLKCKLFNQRDGKMKYELNKVMYQERLLLAVLLIFKKRFVQLLIGSLSLPTTLSAVLLILRKTFRSVSNWLSIYTHNETSWFGSK